MSVARITEISAASTKGFDDAVHNGLKRANKTLKGIKSSIARALKSPEELGETA